MGCKGRREYVIGPEERYLSGPDAGETEEERERGDGDRQTVKDLQRFEKGRSSGTGARETGSGVGRQ